MNLSKIPLPPIAAAATTSLAVVLLVTGSAWFGVLSPAFGAATETATAEVRLHAARAAEAASAQRLKAAERRVATLAEVMADETEPGNFEHRNARLAGLLQVAESVGLEVLRIAPSDPVKREGYADVTIDLEVRGIYESHHRFLGSVLEGPADLSVTSFRLYGTPGGPLSAGYRLRWVVADAVSPQPIRRTPGS